LILDWEAVEAEVGPPLHERISFEAMKKFLMEIGYHSDGVLLKSNVYAIIIELQWPLS